MHIRLKPLLRACLFAALFSPVAATDASPGALNVVFFLVDDFGAHDVGYAGSKVYETPHIDRLAADGTRFTQAHAAFPRCVPSRFAIQTGIHPSRAEAQGEVLTNMSPDRVTLAEVLKSHGYATFFAGKWHLGKEPARLPQAQGYDVNIGGGSAGEPGTYFAPFRNPRGLTGPEGVAGREGEYLTDRLTDEAISFISAKRGERFFVFLSHYAVHTPLQAKDADRARYQAKIGALTFVGPEYVTGPDGRELRHQNNATYAAMVGSVDESLGRIIATLKELGLYDRTLIVLTSDHGGLSNSGPESKRALATSNLPLRAGKGHSYQGGLRVPAIVRWPGVTAAGSVMGHPITGMDYFPSVLEMLGLPLRPENHVDGVSFASVLRDPQGSPAARDLFWYSDRGRRDSTGDLNCATIRRGSLKLMEFFTEQRVELYDLSADPGETRNLAEERPSEREALLAALRAWKREMRVQDRPQQKPRAGERYEF